MPSKAWMIVAGSPLALVMTATPTAFAGTEQPPSASGSAFRCKALETKGLPPDDVATAVDIVCRELASVSGGAGSYEVLVRPLGESVVLTVSRPDAAGGRSLVLDGLAEVPTAARRLADAVVLGKAIEETRLVDNLVRSEGRSLVTRPGSRKFELGAFGLGSSQGSRTGAGFSIALAYDSPAFAIPAELRFAQSSGGDRPGVSVSLFSLDAGGRYFVSRRATSPFVGGGLSFLHLSLSEMRDQRRYVSLEDSRWGPGLYAETGVQLFRLHRGRLTAKLRADFPMFSLHPEGYDYPENTRNPRPMRLDGGSRYVVPLTFGLTMSF
jgi:hypothetical protein